MRWGLAAIVFAGCVRTNPNVAANGNLDLAVAADVDLARALDAAGPVDDLALAPPEAGMVARPDMAGGDFAGAPDLAKPIVCGDQKCDQGEDCVTCAMDCGACVCEAKKASC